MSYSVNVNSMTVTEKISVVYLALLGRVADGIGLDGYLAELDLPGHSFDSVAQEIFAQVQRSRPETVSSPTVTLHTMYQNLFAKEPEDTIDNPARAYWLDNWLVATPPVNIGVVIVNMVAIGYGTVPLTLGRTVMLNRLAALEYGIARQNEQNVSLAATRSMLQPGVTAADTSLAAERAYLDQHTGTLVQGQVLDVGPVTGALVIADANGNGQLDSGEASATTDAAGHYALRNAHGPLIAIGGVDSGVPGSPAVLGRMSAPEYGAVISRLSSVQQTLIAETPTTAVPTTTAGAVTRAGTPVAASHKIDKTASTALADGKDALVTHALGLLGPLEQLDDVPAELTGPSLGTRSPATTQLIAMTTANAEVVDLMYGVAKILVRDADHAVSYDDAIAIVTSALGARLSASTTGSVLPDLSSGTLLAGLLEDARTAMVASATARGLGLSINTSLHGAAVIDILQDGAATYGMITSMAQDAGVMLHSEVEAQHKTVQDRIDALWNVSPVDPSPLPDTEGNPLPAPPPPPSAPPPRTVTVAYVKTHQIASDLTNIATVTGTAADFETLAQSDLNMLVANSADAKFQDTDASPRWEMSSAFGAEVEDQFDIDGKDRLDASKEEVVLAANSAGVTRFAVETNIEKVDASDPTVGMSVAQFMTNIAKLLDNNSIVDSATNINANMSFLANNAGRIRDGGIHANAGNMVDNRSINLTQTQLDALQVKLAPEDSLKINGDPASIRTYTFANYAGANFTLFSPDGSTSYDLTLATAAPVALIPALGTLGLPAFVSVSGGTGNDTITSGAGTDSITIDNGGLNGSVYVRFLANAMANGLDEISLFTPGLIAGGGDVFDFSKFFSAQGTTVNHLVAGLGASIPQTVENGDVLEATLAPATPGQPTASEVSGLFSTEFLAPVGSFSTVVVVGDSSAASLWYVTGSAGNAVTAEQFATVDYSGATTRTSDLIGKNVGINSDAGASVTLNLAQLAALNASNTLSLLLSNYVVTLRDSVANFNTPGSYDTGWFTNVDSVDATGTSVATPLKLTAAAATAIGNGRMTPSNYTVTNASGVAEADAMKAIANLDQIDVSLNIVDYSDGQALDDALTHVGDSREEVTVLGTTGQVNAAIADVGTGKVSSFANVDHIVPDFGDGIQVSSGRFNEIGAGKFSLASSTDRTNDLMIIGDNASAIPLTIIPAFSGDTLLGSSADGSVGYEIHSAASIYSAALGQHPTGSNGSAGPQFIFTENGTDVIFGGPDLAWIRSGGGNDRIFAGSRGDIIQGQGGDDVIDLTIASQSTNNSWENVVFESGASANGADSITGLSVARSRPDPMNPLNVIVTYDRLIFTSFFGLPSITSGGIRLETDGAPVPATLIVNVTDGSEHVVPPNDAATNRILLVNTANTALPTSETIIAGLFGTNRPFAAPVGPSKFIVIAHDEASPDSDTTVWMVDSNASNDPDHTSSIAKDIDILTGDVKLVATIHGAISLNDWTNNNFYF